MYIYIYIYTYIYIYIYYYVIYIYIYMHVSLSLSLSLSRGSDGCLLRRASAAGPRRGAPRQASRDVAPRRRDL